MSKPNRHSPTTLGDFRTSNPEYYTQLATLDAAATRNRAIRKLASRIGSDRFLDVSFGKGKITLEEGSTFTIIYSKCNNSTKHNESR
jgi:hypothetical protein